MQCCSYYYNSSCQKFCIGAPVLWAEEKIFTIQLFGRISHHLPVRNASSVEKPRGSRRLSLCSQSISSDHQTRSHLCESHCQYPSIIIAPTTLSLACWEALHSQELRHSRVRLQFNMTYRSRGRSLFEVILISLYSQSIPFFVAVDGREIVVALFEEKIKWMLHHLTHIAPIFLSCPKAICFVTFLVGFITVLCIGNYFRAKRAQERQRQRRLAKLASYPEAGAPNSGGSYEAPTAIESGVQA